MALYDFFSYFSFNFISFNFLFNTHTHTSLQKLIWKPTWKKNHNLNLTVSVLNINILFCVL